MLDKTSIIKITNRSTGIVGYSVPDLNIQRSFTPGETKEVTVEEVQRLSFTKGGKKLLEKYFILHNEDVVEEILGEVEPEYFYTEAEVKELLLRGSIEQLDDCLTFGNEGVFDMIKKLAVDLEINDISKRDLILKKLGYNVTNAINVSKMDSEEKLEENEATSKRKSSPINLDKPQRKAASPQKYKVTSIKE